MLKSVHFQSIKALHDVRVDLDRLTFLVGPNGCGKSTLLDQIEVLCECSRHDPAEKHVLGHAGSVLERHGLPTLQTSGDTGMMSWTAESTEGKVFSVRSAPVPGREWYDTVALGAKAGGRAESLGSRDHTKEKGKAFDDLISAAFSWRAQRLRLVPQHIALPVDVREDHLDPSGYGLAAVLATFAMNDQDAYAALQADLRTIVPQFDRLHISKVEVRGENGVKHGGVSLGMVMRGAGRLGASAISDGTLLALALLTATHDRDLPPLVLMDDIDHGLHLRAQLTLLHAIRKVMEVRPELQVICTTHSPYLLDAARPEEVRVMVLDASGHTRVRPLVEHPDYEKHHRGLQTGEFWASYGEDWVAAPGQTHE